MIAISTGMADINLISKYDIDVAGPYSISKAALNTAVAKYSALCKKDGILFMSISPGLVETGHQAQSQRTLTFPDVSGKLSIPRLTITLATEEQRKGLVDLAAKFAAYAPHFRGPISTEESVTAVNQVIMNASIKSGSAGSFVSHFGTQQWL